MTAFSCASAALFSSHAGEFFQRFVHGKQLIVIRHRRGNFHLVRVQRFNATAALGCQPPPGMFDQDAAHRLGCRAEKVGAILKRRSVLAAEPKPGFVDERGGLEGVTRSFARHLLRRQPAEFVIDQRQQFRSSLRIAPFHLLQYLSEFAHVVVDD